MLVPRSVCCWYHLDTCVKAPSFIWREMAGCEAADRGSISTPHGVPWQSCLQSMPEGQTSGLGGRGGRFGWGGGVLG